MRNTKQLIFFGLCAGLLAGLCNTAAMAQDPTEVDAKHYKSVFENDDVRVLRITYGPGEESVMHEHPAGVVVFLTDNQVTFALPDGQAVPTTGKKGQAIWDAGGKHRPQNTGDNAMEAILVEMKGNMDLTSIRKAIEAQNAKFAAAYNRGDAAGVAAVYTENAHSMPPNSPAVQGRPAIQKSTKKDMEMGLSNLKLTTLSVERAGNSVYETGAYSIKFQPEGREAIGDSGKYFAVWKAQPDGSWKIYKDIWNSDLPLPGTN